MRRAEGQSLDDDQQGSAGGLLHGLTHLFDESGPVQDLDVPDSDLLVYEPVTRIDEHTNAERGFYLGVEKTKRERILALGPETLLERTLIGFRTTIGDEEESVSLLIGELRHLHTPELKRLGGPQSSARGDKVDVVEPNPQQNQNDQYRAQQQSSFEEVHRKREGTKVSPLRRGRFRGGLSSKFCSVRQEVRPDSDRVPRLPPSLPKAGSPEKGAKG